MGQKLIIKKGNAVDVLENLLSTTVSKRCGRIKKHGMAGHIRGTRRSSTGVMQGIFHGTSQRKME
jgi:hypothetical protein